MPDDRITLGFVVWRDTKADPPPEDEPPKLTDRGWAHYADDTWIDDDTLNEMHPQPRWWAELPVPPSGDSLTLDDLHAALMLAGHGIAAHSEQLREAGASEESVRDIEIARHRVLARLRRAIAEIEKGTP